MQRVAGSRVKLDASRDCNARQALVRVGVVARQPLVAKGLVGRG
jgi:hypothetical protein